MIRLPDLGDESGLTLVELLVALTAGLFVMSAITIAMLTTIRETSRVTSHVESNQRARLTMTKMLKELHSACVAPQIAPIKPGSTDSKLIFVHQVGDEVAPTPIKSEIVLTGTTLEQLDYEAIGGSAPEWKWSPIAEREELMKGVLLIEGNTPLFRFHSYEKGVISPTPLASPLNEQSAPVAVQVSIAFETQPEPPVSEDENAATQIQNTALLRLTPPAYSSATTDLPCQ